MQKRPLAPLFAAVLAGWFGGVLHAQSARTPTPVSYAAFMQQDNEGRLRTYNRLTTGEKTDLMLIHLSRWMAVNLSYLTQEQEQALKDFINVVEPPQFRVPGYKDTPAWRDELVTRIESLFSAAEIRQALTIYGDYIPVQWPPRTH